MDTPQRPVPGLGAHSQPLGLVQLRPSDQNLPPPPKRRRSQACLTACCRTCRLRKVKCTGNPGGGKACSNCIRLELACSFNNPDEPPNSERGVSRTAPSRSHTEAGTVRKRAQRACTECHSHKTKCSGDLPRCKRCEVANLACEYTPAKRKFLHVPANLHKQLDEEGSSPSTAPVESQSPDAGEGVQDNPPIALPDLASLAKENILANKDLVLRHIDAFFEHLYFTPCVGYVHKPTIYKELEENRLHASRAAAICSVAAFFVSPGPKAVAFASRCSMQVEFHLFRNIGSLREANLYLYSFDLLHNHMAGKYAKCWQLISVACRLMLGLQLNWEVPGSKRPFKEQECARRLAWQLFHLDRLIAGGFEAYVICREENMKIRLPCPEDAFNANKEVFVERLNDKPAKNRMLLGVHGYQIKLLNIRHHVLTMSKKFASGPAYLQRQRWEPSKVMEDVRKLQLELSRFSSSLPDHMKLSDQNISRWLVSQERQVFVLLHGLYFTMHIDLYRFSLPAIRERGTPDLLKKLPRDFIIKSQKQAVAHAVTLARFWESTYNMARMLTEGAGGGVVLLGDYTIAPCVEQCTKVLIAAKQHKLHHDLSSQSTAPLWRNEPVDDVSIRGLIDVCLRVLEPWAEVIPSVKPQFQKLTETVIEFDRTSRYEEETILSLSGGDPDSVMRLPGPHYLLEHAFAAQGDSDEEHQKQQQQPPLNPALVARFYSAAAQAEYTHDPYTGLDAPEDDWQSEYCPPGMPLTLAEARGLPMEKPEVTGEAVRQTASAAAAGATAAVAAGGGGNGGVGGGAVPIPGVTFPQGGDASSITVGALPILTMGDMRSPEQYAPQHVHGPHQPIPYATHHNPPVENYGAPYYDDVAGLHTELSQSRPPHDYGRG